MPSPTPHESSPQSTASINPSLQTFGAVPPQPVMDSKDNGGGNAESPPKTNQASPNITSLPNELLMHTFGYLAPDKVEPYLYGASSRAYKQSQKDLRSVCLVSKQMDAAAREYLYRAVIVGNADVLVYLARTLDENLALGQHIKRLVFEIPFISEHVCYPKPNVSVLKSRPGYSYICAMAVDASDVGKYEESLAAQREVRKQYNDNLNSPLKTFGEWASGKIYNILGQLYLETFLRSENLESLCFGRISPARSKYLFHSSSLFGEIGGAMGLFRHSEKVRRLMSKLQELQVHAYDQYGGGEPFAASFVSRFLSLPSLRTLRCSGDNGKWNRLQPLRKEARVDMTPPPKWQCKNVTRIDLQRSRCTPAGILDICATFPSLEYLSVSVEHGTPAHSYSDRLVYRFGPRSFLSTGLAKLKHLRELSLNFHYEDDMQAKLGEHGVLNLGGLRKLTKVRIPLHFLVQDRPGNDPSITDLKLTLPPSVQNLTVWANMHSAKNWGHRATIPLAPSLPRSSEVRYVPRRMALDFMASLNSLLTDHFIHLKEATYCYEDDFLGTACLCIDRTMCKRCLASHFLDPHGTDDSSTQVKILSSIGESHGVRLRTFQEQAEE